MPPLKVIIPKQDPVLNGDPCFSKYDDGGPNTYSPIFKLQTDDHNQHFHLEHFNSFENVQNGDTSISKCTESF